MLRIARVRFAANQAVALHTVKGIGGGRLPDFQNVHQFALTQAVFLPQGKQHRVLRRGKTERFQTVGEENGKLATEVIHEISGGLFAWQGHGRS